MYREGLLSNGATPLPPSACHHKVFFVLYGLAAAMAGCMIGAHIVLNHMAISQDTMLIAKNQMVPGLNVNGMPSGALSWSVGTNLSMGEEVECRDFPEEIWWPGKVTGFQQLDGSQAVFVKREGWISEYPFVHVRPRTNFSALHEEIESIKRLLNEDILNQNFSQADIEHQRLLAVQQEMDDAELRRALFLQATASQLWLAEASKSSIMHLQPLARKIDSKFLAAKNYTDSKYAEAKQYTDNATENADNTDSQAVHIYASNGAPGTGCAFCYTCGGNWPTFKHYVTFYWEEGGSTYYMAPEIRGSSCSETSTNRDSNGAEMCCTS